VVPVSAKTAIADVKISISIRITDIIRAFLFIVAYPSAGSLLQLF
jgi:hypothetical protein